MLANSIATTFRQLMLWDELPDGPMVEKPKVTIVRRPKFDASLLQLPLFFVEGGPETEIPDEMEIKTIGYIPEPEESVGETEESVVWTDEGVAQMHSVLLFESLSALAGRGNGAQKVEILEWIFEPDFFGKVTLKNGQVRNVYNWEVPWSFLFCCKLEGMSNPDIIRDFIRQLLPDGSAKFI